MLSEACYFLLIAVIHWSDIAVCTNEIKLTPSQIDISENFSATLTCSKVNGILAETRWQNSQTTEDANLAFYNGQCIVTRFLLDSDLFEGVCHGNGTYSVVLKRINRTQHGVEWICQETISAISNKAVIHVSVSAVSVTLKKKEDWDYIKENQTNIITCTTSPCRPDPMVQWYLRNRTGQVVNNLTQFSTNNYVNGEYGLKSVKSVLDLRLNRTANNLLLFCEVWTRSIRADITSREISINVTFPPESNPVILGFENVNIMRVIESETENAVCSISGGNPVASLSWNCFGSNDTTTATQGSTVTSTVKWMASRNYSTCSCTSHHILTDWKRTTNVTVNVQYKARVRKYFVLNNVASTSVTVSENETVGLQCEIEGNPTPTCEIYNDNNPDKEQFVNYSQNYVICYTTFNASCLHDSVYTCKGSNDINKAESTEKNINVFVQCSPRPNLSVATMDHVIAEINMPISLHFTAFAYPKPISASWSKFVGQSWVAVNESNNIRIYQSDLDFGMTIIRATNADIGEYKLLISNAIGSFIHIFYIEQKVASTQSDEFAKTGLIIGLTIALIFIVTLVTSVSVVLCRRIKQKRRETDDNHSYQNVSGAISQQIDNDKTYEQIGMNVKKVESTIKEINKFDKEIEDESHMSVTYEKLAETKKDVSQYSQLHSMKETETGTGVGTKISFSIGEEERNIVQSNIDI